MQYLGGKSKIRKQVAAVIEQYRKDGQEYFEPFVGGGWILQEVKGKRTAADGNAATSKRSLLKQLPLIRDVSFKCGNYTEWTPHDMLVYCDPPYAGTTTYGAFDGFDTDLFWNTMRKWSETNTVIVSEYEAPEDFCCIAEFGSRMGLTTGGERPVRAEKVFMRFI